MQRLDGHVAANTANIWLLCYILWTVLYQDKSADLECHLGNNEEGYEPSPSLVWIPLFGILGVPLEGRH